MSTPETKGVNDGIPTLTTIGTHENIKYWVCCTVQPNANRVNSVKYLTIIRFDHGPPNLIIC